MSIAYDVTPETIEFMSKFPAWLQLLFIGVLGLLLLIIISEVVGLTKEANKK